MSRQSIGPELPPGFGPPAEVDSDEEGSSDGGLELHDEEDLQTSTLYGPALPPGFGQKKVLGPAMPPSTCGPSHHCEEEEEEDDGPLVGPAPPSDNPDAAHWARNLEERARRMREKLQPKVDSRINKFDFTKLI